jgi:hypothetical protein
VKTEDLLALLNNGFIREKEVDMWRAAAGDPYPMEKAEDEIPMFARFVERGLRSSSPSRSRPQVGSRSRRRGRPRRKSGEKSV